MAGHYWLAFIYAFARISPLTVVAPLSFLSHVPLMIRTLFTIAIALIIATAMGPQLSGVGESFNLAVFANEFVIGLVLALGFHAVNASLHMMSQLIDVQMGVSAGATFDPVNFQTSGPTGTLFGMLAAAVFFSTGLHYQFFLGLSELFRAIPPGQSIYVTSSYFTQLSKIFVLSFILAGPVIIVLFLTDISLAMISRSMPQAQVYFVALPLKVFIGLVILALTLGMSQKYFYEVIFGALETWNHILIK